MTEDWKLAIVNLISRIGLGAASVILQRLNAPNANLDTAIAALEAAAAKSAEDYLREAREKLAPPTP